MNLSTVIAEFGGTGSVPINMRAYLQYGAYGGWNGGVAQHDNNSAIPNTGTLLLSNFNSPADKDFVSDTYTPGYESNAYDPPNYQTFYGYCSNTTVMGGSGLVYLSGPVGTAGSRINVGKSTYGSTGQTATINMIGDFDNNGYAGFIIGFSGDQRATGWGGAGSIQAPYQVVINGSTYGFANSDVANGTYDSGANATYWTWNNTSGISTNFTFIVSIY